MEYEIPKYDGDMAPPNLYVELSEEICERKVEILMATFRSQASRPWFDPDAFRALMRLRGMESNASSRFAEGFTCRKVVLRDLGPTSSGWRVVPANPCVACHSPTPRRRIPPLIAGPHPRSAALGPVAPRPARARR